LKRSTLWAAELSLVEAPPPSSSPGFIEITPASADALVAAMGREGDRVAVRLARGCRAFGMVDGGVVVAYGWESANTEWVGELQVDITPAPGEAYVWNCFTLEAHRRRGNYRALLEGILAVARTEGLRRLWIGSVEVPAEKADSDAGFVRVLRFEVSRYGPLRRLTVRAVPGANPRLVTEARARIGMRGSSHVGSTRRRIH
jgi:GNAT superfamily N-acetyltransferase